MEYKTCKKCGQEKELSEFYKDKGFKDGYKATCKECNNKTHKGICGICGKEFYSSKKNQIYCSIKCLSESQKKRVKFNCDYCGEESEVAECFYKGKKNHYCSSECRSKHHSILISGENHPRYNSVLIKCDYCDKDIKRRLSQVDERNFCDIDCYSEYRKIHYVGENHSSWNGGSVTLKCDCCGKSISKKKSQVSENNYCSVECMGRDRKRLYSNENNSNWNGGITKISEYLRHNIDEWKMDTLKKYDFKCDVTGSKDNLIIHHLYNFSDIVNEVFEIVRLSVYEQVNDYTEQELNIIKSKTLELHKKYGLGVCLCEEVHKEFHSKYGKKNNTEDQYLEFKKSKLKADKEAS